MSINDKYPNFAFDFAGRHFTGKQVVHGITLGLLATSLYGVRRFFAGGHCYLNKDLSERTVVITGANSGIGKQTARRLLELNATVIFGARDRRKNQQVVKQLTQIGKGKIIAYHLDLADKISIQNFAENVKRQLGRKPLYYLLNNAGIFALHEYKKTKDGLQMQIGVNHFGHFYLTYLLWDKLKQSQNPRIVNVSSRSHISYLRSFDLDFDNLQFQHGGYDNMAAYSRSKKANILFTKQLQRRMQQSGMQGTCVSLHPGLVRTDIQQNYLNWWRKAIAAIFYPILLLVAKTSYEGAQTNIYCLLEDDNKLVKGAYYVDCKLKKTQSQQVQNMNIARRLWEQSQKVWGIKFNV